MANLLLDLAAWAAGRLPARVTGLVYRVGPLAGLVRRVLNRAAPIGVVPVTVAGGTLAGLWMCLDLQREKDCWLGTYEPELQRAVQDWVRPGMVTYDVGANIGYTSLLLKRRAGAGGRVLAFEALPENLERLRINLELSGMGAGVRVVPLAVVDRRRPVRFLVGPSPGMGKVEGSAGRESLEYGTAVEVQGVSLDEFVYQEGSPPPDLVKIDIEGGEVLALPGMRRVLMEGRPVVLLELHGPAAARLAWEEFERAGYRICRMEKDYPVLNSWEELDWKAYLVASPLPLDPIQALHGSGKGERSLEALLKYRTEERRFDK